MIPIPPHLDANPEDSVPPPKGNAEFPGQDSNIRPSGTDDHDDCLLERAAALWQQGDWTSLIRIGRDSIEVHPDRAKVALLIAAAHLQSDQAATAKEFIHLAKEWGCSEAIIARILVSNVHNSIARAAAAGGSMDTASQHFEQSLAIGLPGCDSPTLAKSRSDRQLRDLGLVDGIDGRLQQLKALVDLENVETHLTPSSADSPDLVNQAALGFYHHIDDGDNPPAFLLIDSKSLPRSGLHYLKNTFSRLLGEHFSFCEWYHEVGCCKQHPCALTSYAQHAQESGSCRIRLIKSHDFEHADPILDTNEHLQRLVLVRDPLFTLTSWFELDQMNLYRSVFLEHGINIEKVWLLHEKEVLASIYRMMDSCFEEPTVEALSTWLVDRTAYIVGFMNRWVKPALENPSPHVHLVAYDGIDQYITETIGNFRTRLSPNASKSLEDFSKPKNRQFQRREDPFTAKSKCISAFIRKHSVLFEEAARQVRINDPSNYFISVQGS